MDCAICYDAITAATGKVELSCSHSFHFSCLTTWFATQNGNNHTQSCPCCRHESNEHEKILNTFIYPQDNIQVEPSNHIWYRDINLDQQVLERMLSDFQNAISATEPDINIIAAARTEVQAIFAAATAEVQTIIANEGVRNDQNTPIVARWF